MDRALWWVYSAGRLACGESSFGESGFGVQFSFGILVEIYGINFVFLD